MSKNQVVEEKKYEQLLNINFQALGGHFCSTFQFMEQLSLTFNWAYKG